MLLILRVQLMLSTQQHSSIDGAGEQYKSYMTDLKYSMLNACKIILLH